MLTFYGIVRIFSYLLFFCLINLLAPSLLSHQFSFYYYCYSSTIKKNKTYVSLDGFLFVNAIDNQVSTKKYIAKVFIIYLYLRVAYFKTVTHHPINRIML
jgi:hypothetical protein